MKTLHGIFNDCLHWQETESSSCIGGSDTQITLSKWCCWSNINQEGALIIFSFELFQKCVLFSYCTENFSTFQANHKATTAFPAIKKTGQSMQCSSNIKQKKWLLDKLCLASKFSETCSSLIISHNAMKVSFRNADCWKSHKSFY